MEKLLPKMKNSELRDFLDEKVALYEQPKFIGTDPIQIPHLFVKKRIVNCWFSYRDHRLGKSQKHYYQCYQNDAINGARSL